MEHAWTNSYRFNERPTTTFNLQSYKLDYVESNFIRGNIKTIELLDNNHLVLSCATIQDIFEIDYIHIETMKGFISDYIGETYLVKNIDIVNKKYNIIY